MPRTPPDTPENRFRLKPRPPRDKGHPNVNRFVSRVVGEFNRAAAGSAVRPGSPPRGRGAVLGRGHVAARFAGDALGPGSRRVVIKMRLVVHKTAAPRTLSDHLRYLERDGVAPDGTPGRAYGPLEEKVDTKAFRERCRDDRHHFRFIVGPEDAAELGDLKGFTRSLMQRVEADLGTRLDWVAVDHWDTEHAHVHLVLRGRDEFGRDLIIARDYVQYGMRRRASALATEWLGPRTEREIRESLQREVEQERWTTLDRALRDRAADGVVDLRDPGDASLQQRALLTGRLQRLEALGLAQRVNATRWRLHPDAESVLRTRSERGDIVRTMQRALGSLRREMSIADAGALSAPVVGSVLAKGIADELRDGPYLVIDGVDGKAHYLPLREGVDLNAFPTGAIVAARPRNERAADVTIARLAGDGFYRPLEHRHELLARGIPAERADEVVTGHVRRLEALRRAALVERLAEGLWRVPSDLVDRGAVYDRRRLGNAVAQVQCHVPVEAQVRALGATWLDRCLVGDDKTPVGHHGFGAVVHDALRLRQDFLVEAGLAQRNGGHIVLPADLPKRLRARELTHIARTLARETGLTYRPLAQGQLMTGVYRRQVQIVSGQFALLDDGLGFSLVPWRPALEERLGRSVTASLDGEHAMFRFSRRIGR
jgi:type IV secretory pathway VirD2 relaxase